MERISALECERAEKFYVELKPLENFFEAEAYHQDYLDKNPGGYCHIPRQSMALFSGMAFDPAKYRRPAKELIAGMLTHKQYQITQEAGTEPPFQNEYWDDFRRGIYVDIVTGEPLFSSKDKYESSCGWPAFSKGLDETALVNSRGQLPFHAPHRGPQPRGQLPSRPRVPRRPRIAVRHPPTASTAPPSVLSPTRRWIRQATVI